MNTIQYFKIVGIIYLSYYVILIVWNLLIGNRKPVSKKHPLILSKEQPTRVELENKISDDTVEEQRQKISKSMD